MKTSEKMSQWVAAINAGTHMPTKWHASIMVSGDRIYSYGTHYPLLFRIADKNGTLIWVRNNGGYSSTTSKHIAHAGAHCDIDAPIGGTDGRTIEREHIINAINARIESLTADMASKKRHDTKVYRALENEHATYSGYLSRLV